MMVYIVSFICVVGLAIGQILFKLSAVSWAQTGSLFAFKTLITLLSAVCLYGATSIAWVWVLQKIELGKIYPLMALAFVLVPIGSHFIFGERFQVQYFVGVTFIVLGIAIVTIKA
jgi:drug/metabolite transporter (DMT)-like permease